MLGVRKWPFPGNNTLIGCLVPNNQKGFLFLLVCFLFCFCFTCFSSRRKGKNIGVPRAGGGLGGLGGLGKLRTPRGCILSSGRREKCSKINPNIFFKYSKNRRLMG